MRLLAMGLDADDKVHKRKGYGAALLALVLVAAIVVGISIGGYLIVKKAFAGPEDYSGSGTGRVVVDVDPGDSATRIGETLAKAGVVASADAFANAASEDDRAGSIQPGSYAMRTKMKATAALALMLDPKTRVQTKVTVREGLRATEILDLLAQRTGIPRKDFDAVVRKPAALGLPAWAHGRVEGLLFPATYTISPKAKAADVLEMMVRRFDQAASDTGLTKGADVSGRHYTPLQVLTVASIVQAEAPPQAMPKVSRVLYNRLAKGMPLQLDTTVNYATAKHGVTTTAKDRATRSPYNTYLVKGLPPGPIGSPGEAAIEAALHPAPGPWLYFVAVNPDTGETKFAVTKAEHDRNVAEFRKWLSSHNGSS